MIGVLVLVHEYVTEPAAVLRRHLGDGLEEIDRDHDQVVEVHRARVEEPALVLGVGLGQGLVPRGLRLGGERLVVDQLVLQVRHLGGHLLRRELLGVELELAAGQSHQALRVGLVVDGERRRVTEPLGLPAQDAHAGGVEGHDPHGPGPRADQGGHPGRHLPRRLVGEGDGHDLVRCHVPRGEQVGDPVGQYAGLARPRARDDEQRAAFVHHGSALLRIESVEEGVYCEGGHVPRVGGCTDTRGYRGRAAWRAARARTRSRPGPRDVRRATRNRLVTHGNDQNGYCSSAPADAPYGLLWPP